MKYSPVSNETTNSNLNEDDNSSVSYQIIYLQKTKFEFLESSMVKTIIYH